MGEVVMDITEFSGARNVQALAKQAINSSVRELMHSAQEWPFALTTYSQTLATNGTATYNFPSDTSSVDWESFYLKQLTAANNEPRRLPVLAYPEYLDTLRPIDEAAGAGGYGPTQAVVQTQESKFSITPPADQAYVIEYKYWSFPADMAEPTDTCIVPTRFDSVIIDCAMTYMMIYRSNEQSANLHRERFEQGIKTMRRLLMDEPLAMRSTMIVQSRTSQRVA
jgi:hypothetical protein